MLGIGAWIVTLVIAAAAFVLVVVLRPSAPFIFAITIACLAGMVVAITASHKLTLEDPIDRYYVYLLLLFTGCATAGAIAWLTHSYYQRENLYCLLPREYR